MSSRHSCPDARPVQGSCNYSVNLRPHNPAANGSQLAAPTDPTTQASPTQTLHHPKPSLCCIMPIRLFKTSCPNSRKHGNPAECKSNDGMSYIANSTHAASQNDPRERRASGSSEIESNAQIEIETYFCLSLSDLLVSSPRMPDEATNQSICNSPRSSRSL